MLIDILATALIVLLLVQSVRKIKEELDSGGKGGKVR